MRRKMYKVEKNLEERGETERESGWKRREREESRKERNTSGG